MNRPQNDDDESIGPFGWFIATFVSGGLAVLVLVTDIWEDQIVGYTGRRRAWFADLLNNIGQTNFNLILSAIAVFCLLMGIRSWIKLSKEDESTTNSLEK